MAKKRVYELAKEMGLDNKELISRLEKIGIAVKSHSSTLVRKSRNRRKNRSPVPWRQPAKPNALPNRSADRICRVDGKRSPAGRN